MIAELNKLCISCRAHSHLPNKRAIGYQITLNYRYSPVQPSIASFVILLIKSLTNVRTYIYFSLHVRAIVIQFQNVLHILSMPMRNIMIKAI